MAFRVAVIGDSAMWGQGLLREQTFAHRAATALAERAGEPLEILPGRGEEPLRGEARSGATLTETVPRLILHETADGDLIGGLADAQRVRNDFVDAYPYLFGSDEERSRFRQGLDERPAARLYGENPASFPTVADQIRHLGENGGADVDLVLLDGGVNDVDFEGVLNSQEGPDLATVLAVVERVFTTDLDATLHRARRAFPNAVIVVTGYFAGLSRESDRGAIKKLFEHMSGKPEWQLQVNSTYQSFPLPFWVASPALGAILQLLTTDVDALITESVRRTVLASAHAAHHIHRTVAEFTSAAPGVVFAHPAFRPEHAAFAPESLVFEGYDVDADAGPTAIRDPQTQRRADSVPGRRLLDHYRLIGALATQIDLGFDDFHDDLARSVREVVEARRISGSMRRAGDRYLDNRSEGRARDLIAPAARELARIERALMASFLHPNEQGAQRYSAHVVTASDRRTRFALRSALAPDPDRGVSLGSVLRRLGSGSSIRRLAAVARPDCLAVVASGVRNPSIVPGRLRFSFGDGIETEVPVVKDVTDELLAPVECVDRRMVDLTTLVVTRIATLGDPPDLASVVVFVNGRRMWSFDRADALVDGDRLTFTLVR